MNLFAANMLADEKKTTLLPLSMF